MDPTPKKIMSGKKSNLAGLLQTSLPHHQQQQLPPFQDLTASPQVKKGNKGSHPQFHARTVVLFFLFLEVTAAAPVITSNLYGETRYLCKRYFF